MICHAAQRIYFCCNRNFSGKHIGEGRTATTAVLAILDSSLRRCAPEWSCWRMLQAKTKFSETLIWVTQKDVKLSLPRTVLVVMVQDTFSSTTYYIAVNMQPWKQLLYLNFLNIYEFCGERTERYQRILLQLLHRQFYLIDRAHTHYCHGRCSSLKWQLLRHN